MIKRSKPIKHLINKLLNRQIDLDNDGKIEGIREEVKGVFSQFKDMRDKLSDANFRLLAISEDEKQKKEASEIRIQTVIDEENRKKAIADKRIEKIELERQANERLQENLDKFIL